MENYRQDFGFYCSKEPISVIAGKILWALQPQRSANVMSDGRTAAGLQSAGSCDPEPDEPCLCDTLQEKYDLIIANDMYTWNYKKERMSEKEETKASHNRSAIHSSNSFFPGYYDKIADAGLPVKRQVLSSSLSSTTLTRSDIDQDYVQPFLNICSDIVQEDRERQKKKPVAFGRNNNSLSEMSVPEINRKWNGVSDGIKLWNIWTMNEEKQCRLLDMIRQAEAIVLTMLFEDGSSQLSPSKDDNTLMNGVLLLIKTKNEFVSNAEINHANNTYIHITITDDALWEEGQIQHSLLRTTLLHILQSKAPVICFNAKDFLRTIYGKFMNCRNVAQSVFIDPRIAAWLLNPAGSSSSFEDLVKKHSATLDTGATSNAPQSCLQTTCKKLSALYNLMVSLEHKLQEDGLWDLFYTIELPLITILAVMENCSIEINQEELKKTSVLLGTHLKGLEKEAHHAAGETFRLTSSNELREILYEKFRLHLKCKSKLPQTNLGHRLSTAEPALNQLKDLHPLPGIILQFRQIQKIKSTFVDGLLTYVNKGCVSPTWNQTGTVSGRLSAKHPNIQGVSKFSVQFEKHEQGKSKEAITINPRSMFVSTKGYSFLAADFSQIELRLLAHFSADPALLKLFHETERTDVFRALASQWKDVEYENITQAEREQAKRVVYSVIYGIGKERLAECLGTTPAEANTFIEGFLQKYRVSDFTQKVIQECHSKAVSKKMLAVEYKMGIWENHRGFVISLMGRKRPLPYINSKNYVLRAQAERQAVNFVIQGSAADLCKLAMIKISASVTSSFYLTARLIAQIHDELLFEVQDSQLQEFAEVVKGIMESMQHTDSVQLKVPLKVSLTSGKSWGCMTELQVK